MLWGKDDTYGKDVVNLFERDILCLHLTPDGIRCLDTLNNLVIKSHTVELFTDRSRKRIENSITFCLSISQFVYNCLVFFLVLVTETEVLQFALYLVESESVCQRSIDIECLTCNLIPFVGSLSTEGTHVMEAVGYLDKYDTDVITHREQEFLEVLSLSRSMVTENTTGNLRQSVNDLRNLRTEHIFDVLDCVVGILNYIVEQCRTDGCTAKSNLGTDNPGNSQRVHDVRFAGETTDTFVCLLRKVESLGDDFNFLSMFC